jgi:hypothetical protein
MSVLGGPGRGSGPSRSFLDTPPSASSARCCAHLVSMASMARACHWSTAASRDIGWPGCSSVALPPSLGTRAGPKTTALDAGSRRGAGIRQQLARRGRAGGVTRKESGRDRQGSGRADRASTFADRRRSSAADFDLETTRTWTRPGPTSGRRDSARWRPAAEVRDRGDRQHLRRRGSSTKAAAQSGPTSSR